MSKRPPKDWHEPFLKALARTRNVDKAAVQAGIQRSTAYKHYKADVVFAARWDEALKWQTGFLLNLSQTGNITLAARSVGIGRRTAYDERGRDPDFAARWDDMLWEGKETLEGIALQRATTGMSDRLLIFLINKADARLGQDPLARPAMGSPFAARPSFIPPAPVAPPAIPMLMDDDGVSRPPMDYVDA